MLAVENIFGRCRSGQLYVYCAVCSPKNSRSLFSTQSICLRSPFLKRILFPHHFGKIVISGLFAEFKSFRVLRNQRSQACFSVQFNHSSSLNENSLLSIMFLQN